jgi:predicted GIY-YIG superfamily endonuclease
MTKSHALMLEYKIKVIGRENKVALVEGRLELYKTVNGEWSFALPGVLNILRSK